MRKVTMVLLTLGGLCAFSQTVRTLDIPLSREARAFPSFTDENLYNSYDFCNSPVGIFDLDSLRLRAHAGLDLVRWHAAERRDSLRQQYTALNVPDILFEKPKMFAVRLFYAPTWLGDETDTVRKLSLPLHRFGFLLAAQAPSGIFQFALNSKGFIGKEKLVDSADNRTMMGLDDLTLTIGSRVHPLLAIGMRGGVTARFDTLNDVGSTINRDRYFSGHIPLLEWYVDFGKGGFPVQSGLSITKATSRLVYVSGNDMDQNPLKGDSLALTWQVLGRLRHAGITVHPAFILSYWKNSIREYQPTVDNDDLAVGPELSGWDRQLSDFRFGIGSLIAIKRFASVWIEYTRPSMRLHYGDSWSTLVPDKNVGYHRTSIGLLTNLHALPALGFPSSAETMFRIGYFNQTENSGIKPFGEEMFGLMTPAGTFSQAYRYYPDFGWGPLQRVSGITLGLTGTFFDKRLEADAHVCFLSRNASVRNRGTVFGLDIAYVLR
ncbi:MAG: hypothetical protein JW699_05320 [Chitinispirillaceae bacterium]|nr:hypothetical protein [Chitinispirillaceae bacterium]